MTLQKKRSRCSCYNCGTSMIAVPDIPCPDCRNGVLEEQWANHCYVEDLRRIGTSVVQVTYSVDPLSGKHCTYNKAKE